MEVISTAQPPLRLTAAAQALGIARATLFRSMARLKHPPVPMQPRSRPPRAFSVCAEQPIFTATDETAAQRDG